MKKIFFDPYKDFSNLTHEGYIYCNNFIAKVLSVYFKDKGYKTEDDTVFTDRFTISWSFHAAGFSIDYYNGKTQRAAYLMRYHDYPNIDEDFLGVTWVPSAAWVLGFVERLVYTFDMSLLKILEDENEDYELIPCQEVENIRADIEKMIEDHSADSFSVKQAILEFAAKKYSCIKRKEEN